LLKALKTEELRLPKFVAKAEESKEKEKENQAKLKTVKDQLLSVTDEAERLQPLLKEKRDAFSAAKQSKLNAQVR
jgi:hypothetical protein